jgi:hypothetical protein
VFESVVGVACQSVFHLEIHQNNIFLKKIIFDINTSKRSKNIKKINLSKNRSFKI